jgi:hypothetical protein
MARAAVLIQNAMATCTDPRALSNYVSINGTKTRANQLRYHTSMATNVRLGESQRLPNRWVGALEHQFDTRKDLKLNKNIAP